MLRTRSNASGCWLLAEGRAERPFAASELVGQRTQKEESELRFEVNGQTFFVNFVPEEGRWYCYAPTDIGVQRIPVSMDTAPFEAFAIPMDEQAKEVVN